jgi:hypothetical protein
METRVGSPKSPENPKSIKLFLLVGLTHELAFFQALFSYGHCFLFQFFSRALKDVLKELNWFVKKKIVKITLFWGCYSVFHYFNYFCCFQNLCS